MNESTKREAQEKVASMTRGIGYVLAVAGLVVWFILEMPLFGAAMVLAGVGDIAIAAFLRKRMQRADRGSARSG